jgi:hypothetical protein
MIDLLTEGMIESMTKCLSQDEVEPGVIGVSLRTTTNDSEA